MLIVNIVIFYSSTYAFLNRLQSLGKQHHFFYPGYTPREMERIPAVYKSIIDSPSIFREAFHTAKSNALFILSYKNITAVIFYQ